MRDLRNSAVLCLLLAFGLAAPASAAASAHWSPLIQLPNVADLFARPGSGAILADQTTGLATIRPGRRPTPYARAYVSPGGDEPYMAVAPPPRRGRCSFGAGTVYVLRLVAPTGVTAVDRHGRVRQFANIPGPGLETGIAFDPFGSFRYRLLVTVTAGIESTLYAIDCHGHVSRLASHVPKVEGGMVVAPRSFGGRFGGRLIAADEVSGHLYAIAPSGAAEVVAPLDLPVGGDIGAESLGFVPRGFGRGWRALVADRVTPGSSHPGDGAILTIPGLRLRAAGVRAGDLLVVSEGGAEMAAVRCRGRCVARRVAAGPAPAHVEGHVIFVRLRSRR